MGQNNSRVLKEPWRQFNNFNEWNDEAHKKLTQEIADFKPSRTSLKCFNIGFVGYKTAGKTSFLSTISSIDNGRPSQVAPIGDTGTSVSKTLRVVPLSKQLKGITLYDTMGLHEGESGLRIEYIEKLINGNLKENFKFENANGEPEEYRNDPTPQDRMKCMVFVANIINIAQSNVSGDERRTIEHIITTIQSHGIPAFAILTNVDYLCDKVKEDVTNTYKSVAVQGAVDKAKELFRIPKMNIFPVQNYTDNNKTDRKMEILTLLALRTMYTTEEREILAEQLRNDILEERSEKSRVDLCLSDASRHRAARNPCAIK